MRIPATRALPAPVSRATAVPARVRAVETFPAELEAITTGAAWGMVICLLLAIAGWMPAEAILRVSGPVFLALVVRELAS